MSELVGGIVGLLLTLFIFSYLLGDNFLFRLATHIFIGVAAGYVAMLALTDVVWPRLVVPLISGDQSQLMLAAPPVVLSVLLFLKVVPRLSKVGTPAMAFFAGVAAATVVGGAVLGTLFPQVTASWALFDLGAMAQSGRTTWLELLNGVIILVGTVFGLGYFQFGLRVRAGVTLQKPAWMQIFTWVGGIFIAIALGALFGGVILAALTTMVERVFSMLEFLFSFLPGGG